MNTSEILKEMNITFDDEKDSLFDFFLKHKGNIGVQGVQTR